MSSIRSSKIAVYVPERKRGEGEREGGRKGGWEREREGGLLHSLTRVKVVVETCCHANNPTLPSQGYITLPIQILLLVLVAMVMLPW